MHFGCSPTVHGGLFFLRRCRLDYVPRGRAVSICARFGLRGIDAPALETEIPSETTIQESVFRSSVTCQRFDLSVYEGTYVCTMSAAVKPAKNCRS